MGINDWPEQEHPRERLIARGPRALSNAELLAVLLRVGVKDVSAVPLAEAMIGASARSTRCSTPA